MERPSARRVLVIEMKAGHSLGPLEHPHDSINNVSVPWFGKMTVSLARGNLDRCSVEQ